MELDIRKTLSVLFSKFWIILLATIVSGLFAFIVNMFFVTPMYTSQATLYVNNMAERKSSVVTSNDVSVSKELVSTCIVILNSRTILDKVAREAEVDYTANQLKSMISAGAVSSTEIFRVQVRNPDPLEAKKIADAILKVAPSEIKRVINGGSVSIIDYATTPLAPSSPNIPKQTVVGAFLGAVFAVILIIIVNLLDTRIKSEFDLVANFELPILGVVPAFKLAEKAALSENSGG